MKVIPAVDILDGKAVSLYQGDFDRREVEKDDPLAIAKNFCEQGADELHIVDLNGAREGYPGNKELIMNILEDLPEVKIQVGGGIRSINTAREYLQAGADAVIIGTAAIKNPYLIGEMIQEFGGDRVIVSLDAEEGELAVSGWEEKCGVGIKTQLARIIEHGVERLIYTDIDKDGTLEGPDIQEIKSVGRYEIEVTASGGISSLEEIERLAEHGIDRAIVGTALYKEKIEPENLWDDE